MKWCKMALVPYSQHSNFFITHKWAQKARVLHYTRLIRLGREKYYSLLGPFVSYKGDEVV
jgi:hypothetical protein